MLVVPSVVRFGNFRVRAAHGWVSEFRLTVFVLFGGDGCRLGTCLPDSCHTLRRVSGVRFVWVGWILALGSDVLPCMPFQLWSKSKDCLGRVVGFLCCVPIVKAFVCPIVPRSSSVAPRVWTRDEPRSFLRDPPHDCRDRGSQSFARALGCGTPRGYTGSYGPCFAQRAFVANQRTTVVPVLGGRPPGGLLMRCRRR